MEDNKYNWQLISQKRHLLIHIVRKLQDMERKINELEKQKILIINKENR